MNHVDTIELDEVMLVSPALSVRWEPCPEGGIEILGVTLGNTEVMDLLSEVTLETIAEEITHGTL